MRASATDTGKLARMAGSYRLFDVYLYRGCQNLPIASRNKTACS